MDGFVHRGYWRDIGTIGAFHAASLELTHQLPSLNLYDARRPVYTRPRFLPPVKITDCHIFESLLSDGAILSGPEIADRSSASGPLVRVRVRWSIARS